MSRRRRDCTLCSGGPVGVGGWGGWVGCLFVCFCPRAVQTGAIGSFVRLCVRLRVESFVSSRGAALPPARLRPVWPQGPRPAKTAAMAAAARSGCPEGFACGASGCCRVRGEGRRLQVHCVAQGAARRLPAASSLVRASASSLVRASASSLVRASTSSLVRASATRRLPAASQLFASHRRARCKQLVEPAAAPRHTAVPLGLRCAMDHPPDTPTDGTASQRGCASCPRVPPTAPPRRRATAPRAPRRCCTTSTRQYGVATTRSCGGSRRRACARRTSEQRRLSRTLWGGHGRLGGQQAAPRNVRAASTVRRAGDNICRRAVQHAGDNICSVQHAGDNICSVQHARATHRSGTSDSTGCVLTARSATSSSQRWCDDSCAATHAHVHSRTRPPAPAPARARPFARPPAPTLCGDSCVEHF